MPTAPIGAEVRDGWFQRVDADQLRRQGGRRGAQPRPHVVSHVTEPLGYGMKYTWVGSVVGRDGIAVPVQGSFTTVEPDSTVNGQFQLADGRTVGVAAPIILQFDASISDKAAVERALIVTTEPATEGSWAWLPDEAKARGCTGGPGTTTSPAPRCMSTPSCTACASATAPTAPRTPRLNFTIGRRQVVKANAPSHRIQVDTDAGVIMDFPCSYGEGDLPRNITRSGTHVVSEKYTDFYMSNPAAGYSNIHERYAVRISNNGEFIHCNPESIGAQGNTNVTNGCINLNLDNASEYFNSAIYGDPVEVTGTSIQLSYSDGDIWDWAVDWDTWRSMSALTPEQPPRGDPSTRARPRRRAPHNRSAAAPAAEPRRGGLVARPDHDQVQVDVRRP